MTLLILAVLALLLFEPLRELWRGTPAGMRWLIGAAAASWWGWDHDRGWTVFAWTVLFVAFVAILARRPVSRMLRRLRSRAGGGRS